MIRHSILFPVLLLCLAFAEHAVSLPILNATTELTISEPDYLRVELQGRLHTDEFAQVNELIARGRSAELIAIANRVLATAGETGLAYEVKGIGYLIQHQTRAAIENFRKATELEPGQSTVHAKLGLVLMETGELQLAEASLAKALQLDDRNLLAHRNLGLLKEYQGEDDTAIYHLLRGIQEASTGLVPEATALARLLTRNGQAQLAIDVLAPRLPVNADNHAAQLVLANSLLERRRWDDALTRFEKAEKTNPNDQLTRLGKAVALRGAGRVQDSIALLRSILSATVFPEAVLVELGLGLQSAGDEAAAAITFDEAVKQGGKADAIALQRAQQYLLDSEYSQASTVFKQLVAGGSAVPEVYVSLSELNVAEGDVEAGVSILKQAQGKFPDNAYVNFRLGSLLAATGQYREALAELERANTLAPGVRQTVLALSNVHTRLGDHVEAARLAALLQSAFATDPQIQLFAALAFSRAGQTDESIDAYERVLEYQPNNALVLNNLAYLMVQAGKLERADQLSSLAVETVPDNAAILDTYGWVKYSQGQYDAAQATFEKAVSLAPELAVAHYHLGLVKIRQNKVTEARVMFERARALDPDATWISAMDELLQQLD